MTGRYPDLVGVPGVIRTDPGENWGYFDPAATTLPEMLSQAGYHTCHIGKWHLGLEPENHPRERGFDSFRGFLGDMMDDYYTHRRQGHNYMRHDYKEVDPKGHATDLFTQWAVSYLQERAGKAEPFFCYLAYNAPHTPIQPPPEWVDRVRAREKGIDDKRALYLGLVEHMDDGIGQVLAALDETGLAGNTIVIFSSDNGGWLPAGASNDPLRGGKLDMYEGGIRVPCCIRWPGHISPGRATDGLAMLMDLFPTCCEIAGVVIDHEIEGRSILQLLCGEGADSADRWYYWVRRDGGASWDRRCVGNDYHAVRHGSLKLLHNHAFAPLELFDMANDPLEQSGLDTKTHPAMTELCEFMQAQIQRAGGVVWQKRSSN
jgi:arylsulfatase A-like enzyme